MHSFKDYILLTLLRHKAGSLQDTVKIQLGCAVLLARGRSLGHQLRGVHLRPMHLSAGKGHSRAFNTDRLLDGFKPRAGAEKPLHESEVAAGNGFGRP